jgi:hypothetical protein
VNAKRRPQRGATPAGTRQSSHSQGNTAAELEALIWLKAADRWLHYGLEGHVPLAEAVDAARLLLARAA